MKHNLKITLILLSMFLITQLIGLAVIHAYSPKTSFFVNETTGEIENITIIRELPYGLQPPEAKASVSLTNIIIAMIIAVLLMLLLMRVRAKFLLRIWFFIIVAIAIAITLNGFFNFLPFFKYTAYLTFVFGLILAFYKVFKRYFILHNLTELLIYPGLAAIFVPLLNIYTAILLLILISAYDIYAVWHAGFMQKMAKFQINELKIFAGFFIPQLDKKTKEKLKKIKAGKISKYKLKNKKFRVNIAILGGGDVAFPLILAGVVFRSFGLLHALFISVFALLALLFLFFIAEKGKFYPAMPFLTIGCFIGLALGFLL